MKVSEKKDIYQGKPDDNMAPIACYKHHSPRLIFAQHSFKCLMCHLGPHSYHTSEDTFDNLCL